MNPRIRCLMNECGKTFANEAAMEAHHEKAHAWIWNTDLKDGRA